MDNSPDPSPPEKKAPGPSTGTNATTSWHGAGRRANELLSLRQRIAESVVRVSGGWRGPCAACQCPDSASDAPADCTIVVQLYVTRDGTVAPVVYHHDDPACEACAEATRDLRRVLHVRGVRRVPPGIFIAPRREVVE